MIFCLIWPQSMCKVTIFSIFAFIAMLFVYFVHKACANIEKLVLSSNMNWSCSVITANMPFPFNKGIFIQRTTQVQVSHKASKHKDQMQEPCISLNIEQTKAVTISLVRFYSESLSQ